MNQLTDFIESGILELYVMGIASPEEAREVERMRLLHPEIGQEIEQISQGLEEYALAQAVRPKDTLKPLIMASIDYVERLQNGETITEAPRLNPASKPEDFAFWLNKEEFRAPTEFEGAQAKIISATPQATTAVVWLKTVTDPEVHHNEYEHFLILEGSCEFTVGDTIHYLKPGDYLAIPLHMPHTARITSREPCKVILQRVAA